MADMIGIAECQSVHQAASGGSCVALSFDGLHVRRLLAFACVFCSFVLQPRGEGPNLPRMVLRISSDSMSLASFFAEASFPAATFISDASFS